MQPKLYVGNLHYDVSENDLQTLFEKYGEVRNVTVIRDRFTGQSKGFGFVEMANAADAEKALAENGNNFSGRNLMVSEAKPQQKRRDGGSGGQRGGGRQGGYGDYGRRGRY